MAVGDHTSEEDNAVFHLFRIVESEYHTGQPLYDHSKEESDDNEYENGHNDGKSRNSLRSNSLPFLKLHYGRSPDGEKVDWRKPPAGSLYDVCDGY